MNVLFGAYIPRLSNSGDLIFRLFLLVIAGTALVMYSRQRQRTWVSLAAVSLGLILAVVPPVVFSTFAMSDGYGDFLREENQVDLPDWFFALFVYFDVGWETLSSLVGMFAGCILLRIGSAVLPWKTVSPESAKP